ncbi:sugar transporter ERD6-like 16 [Ricinus communis]|uniref:sugar transporter ERD6-like 16 n=1 Tax=Ricinus communis TaxID=3988 RepID=UPI0007729D6E|nr:sugar transporter ERD6-like 16 [Ricinus communis]|eukprot:XP_015575628.1 sugar transporter ERD6-like 16 [Ricinus communis]
MAMEQAANNGQNKMKAEMKEPLIQTLKIKVDNDDEFQTEVNNKISLGVVLLSTFVTVLGSYEFGSCISHFHFIKNNLQWAPVQSSIREDLDLSLAEFSLFGSIVTVGSMIGAIMSGTLQILLSMRMSAVICITGWTAIYFSPGALSLDAGRFLTGYSIGLYTYVVSFGTYIYIAEIAPKELRGGLATMNQLMIVIGGSTAFLVGTVATWKMLALTGTIPCILQLLGLVFIPESPRWLAKTGYEEEFENALRRQFSFVKLT